MKTARQSAKHQDIKVCCVCGKIQMGAGSWVSISDEDVKRIKAEEEYTDDCCPECRMSYQFFEVYNINVQLYVKPVHVQKSGYFGHVQSICLFDVHD